MNRISIQQLLSLSEAYQMMLENESPEGLADKAMKLSHKANAGKGDNPAHHTAAMQAHLAASKAFGHAGDEGKVRLHTTAANKHRLQAKHYGTSH